MRRGLLAPAHAKFDKFVEFNGAIATHAHTDETCGFAAESRMNEALKAIQLAPVIPMWGVIPAEDGSLICECRKGKSCRSAGKHPRSVWKKTGSRDPDTVRDWFAKWPEMNFGARTDGLVVLDVDFKNDGGNGVVDGLASIRAVAEDAEDGLRSTVAVASGRGYGHFYFKKPDHTTTKSMANVLPGVDIRSQGGCIVLPGSRHRSGRQYRWIVSPDEKPLSEMPAWLQMLLAKSATPATRREKPTGLVRLAHSHPMALKQEVRRSKADAFDEQLRTEFGIDVQNFVVRDNASPPGWKLKALLSRRKANHGRIIASWEYARSSLRYPMRSYSPSEYELALADFAACNGWTPQEIVDLIVRWRWRHSLPVSKLTRLRLLQTLRSAYRAALERDRIRKRGGRPRSDLGARALALKEAEPHLSTKDIGQRLGVSAGALRTALWRMKKAGGVTKPHVYHGREWGRERKGTGSEQGSITISEGAKEVA